jgi:hypothetical protein
MSQPSHQDLVVRVQQLGCYLDELKIRSRMDKVAKELAVLQGNKDALRTA